MEKESIDVALGTGFLTKRQIAKLLQVTTRTIDDYMKKGILPFYKWSRIVRFRWDEVQASLAQNCRVARRALGASKANLTGREVF